MLTTVASFSAGAWSAVEVQKSEVAAAQVLPVDCRSTSTVPPSKEDKNRTILDYFGPFQIQ